MRRRWRCAMYERGRLQRDVLGACSLTRHLLARDPLHADQPTSTLDSDRGAPLVNKVIVASCSVIAIALLVGGSCSIRHASDSYTCETTADCTAGRSCSDGYCLVVSGAPADATGDRPRPDAPVSIPDASQCPSQCTSCDVMKHECIIDCAVNPTGCVAQVVCPAGWHCNIACTPASSCRMGVNCLGSLSCNVDCAGAQSCRNVACGPGRCDVTCSGNQSCSGVSCGQSCACDVDCGNQASCSNVSCNPLVCDTFDGGCSSQSFGCDTCP